MRWHEIAERSAESRGPNGDESRESSGLRDRRGLFEPQRAGDDVRKRRGMESKQAEQRVRRHIGSRGDFSVRDEHVVCLSL